MREAEIVLAGGAENMSQTPYAVRDMRFGTKFGTDYKVMTLPFVFILLSNYQLQQKQFHTYFMRKLNIYDNVLVV